MITLKTKMRRMIKISANHDFYGAGTNVDDGDDNLNQKWQKMREIMLRMTMMIRKR